jgi:hypothetical protein
MIKINEFLENRFKANRDKSITESHNKNEKISRINHFYKKFTSILKLFGVESVN